MNDLNNEKYLAEFVGILLGDGSINVYNKNLPYYRLKISLNSAKDKLYSEYISKLILLLFNEKPFIKKRKNENTLDVLIFKRNIINSLLKLGLEKSPKWNRAIIPAQFLDAKLSKYVLRGYFDTDGCIAITNNNGITYPRIEMKICPSPMQNQFIEILSSLKFKFGSYNIGKGKVRIQINGKEQLRKWYYEVGSNNPRNLNKIKTFIND